MKRRPGQAGISNAGLARSIGFQASPPFQCWSMPNSGKPLLRSCRTMSVHQTWCGQPSRRLSRPVTWSIWLSSRMIAAMPVSRGRRAGCSGGKASSWARMSGEALHSTQSMPLALMAMDDCVRGWARTLPLRTPRQLRQLQFHWGKPPPAAEPRIWMCMGCILGGGPGRAGAMRISGWRSTG
ncbi:hypothetical protein D9M70_553340 [compost metagenome]